MITDTIGRTQSGIAIQDVEIRSEQVLLRIHVPRSILFTSELPGFADRLLNRIPSLWRTLCHNDHGLSFPDELSATEMGHVFEHVVLALLTSHGIYARGTTEWNWFRDPEGTFTITLGSSEMDPVQLEACIVEAEAIIDELVGSLTCERGR